MWRFTVLVTDGVDTDYCQTVYCNMWRFTVLVTDGGDTDYCQVQISLTVTSDILNYCNCTVCWETENNRYRNTISAGLFMSSSGTSKLHCATTKTDTTERSISIGRES